MPSKVRQTSFAGGELSPLLHARTDLPRYAQGLRRCRNFMVSGTGALLNRPGLKYCGATKSNGAVRLVPFEADGRAFILEFGNFYMRVWEAGAPVLDGAAQVEIVTPYATAELPLLTWAQDTQTLTLCSPSRAPYELTYTSSTSWALAEVNFAGREPHFRGGVPRVRPRLWNTVPEPPFPGLEGFASTVKEVWEWKVTTLFRDETGRTRESRAFDVTEYWVYSRPLWAVGTTYAAGAEVSKEDAGNPSVGHADYYRSLQANNVGHDPEDAGDPGWWEGPLESTTKRGLPLPEQLYLSTANPITLDWDGYTPTEPSEQILGWRIYRGRNGNFGFVGEVTAPVFEDAAVAPDYYSPPPEGRDPFDILDADGAVTRTEHPRTVAYYQQRRIFGGTAERPSTLFWSQIGEPSNFDLPRLRTDDDSFASTLASTRFESIRGLVALRALLAITSSGQWAIALSGTVPDQLRQGDGGGGWLPPLVASNAVLAVDESGGVVRELLYGQSEDSYGARELSQLAEHLLQGRSVVGWAYQRRPHQIVWLVRDDGVLLGLTYSRDMDVIAWHWHDTDGLVEQVCVIPEGAEDGLYAVVKRTVGGASVRYLERLSTRVVLDAREGCFLDSAVSVDNRGGLGAMQFSLLSTGWLPGATIEIIAAEEAFDAGMVGDHVILDPDGARCRLRIAEVASAYTATLQVLDSVPAAFRHTGTQFADGTWAIAKSSVSGLGHLEGLEVSALADGAVVEELTVEGGAVTLPTPALVAHVGLPYTSEAELLDLAPGGAEVKGRVKAVLSVGFEVVSTRGLQVGESFERLQEWKSRRVEAGYATDDLKTELALVAVRSSWNSGGRAVVVQSDPLPVTLLSVIRDVELGG